MNSFDLRAKILLGIIGVGLATGVITMNTSEKHNIENKAKIEGYQEGYQKGKNDTRPNYIFAEDVNRDGINDLVIYNSYVPSIYIGSTNGTYEPFAEYKERLLSQPRAQIQQLETEFNSMQRNAGNRIFSAKPEAK